MFHALGVCNPCRRAGEASSHAKSRWNWPINWELHYRNSFPESESPRLRDNLKLSKLCETFKGKTEGESEGCQRGRSVVAPDVCILPPHPPTFPGSRRTVGLSADLRFRVQFSSKLLITWRNPGFKNEWWLLEYNSPVQRDQAPSAALLALRGIGNDYKTTSLLWKSLLQSRFITCLLGSACVPADSKGTPAPPLTVTPSSVDGAAFSPPAGNTHSWEGAEGGCQDGGWQVTLLSDSSTWLLALGYVRELVFRLVPFISFKYSRKSSLCTQVRFIFIFMLSKGLAASLE